MENGVKERACEIADKMVRDYSILLPHPLKTELIAYTYKMFYSEHLPFPKISNVSVMCKGQCFDNAANAHWLAIEYAKTHNWPYVLVFEGDVYPCRNVK